jgi:hypothetical protein
MTQADLGLADAYINGDFSFVDKKEGLLNFFMVRSINLSLIQVFFFLVFNYSDIALLIYFTDSYCQ